MAFRSWRGVVGVIKPTHRPGSLEEFIRLIPEGIGVVPLFLGIKTGTEKEFSSVLDVMKEKIAELAELDVDIIHAEGAPPFMLLGYEGETKLIKSLAKKYKRPVSTSGSTQVEALKALKIKRFVGVTYFTGSINKKYARYFSQAGFDVLGMDGISVPFDEVGRLASQEVYAFVKEQFLKYKRAQGIYLLGSGWRVLPIIRLLEQDLQVPVVHPVPARVWAVQKELRIRESVEGYGRLLEEMP
jgi:maleate cis-trans isomerase